MLKDKEADKEVEVLSQTNSEQLIEYKVSITKRRLIE